MIVERLILMFVIILVTFPILFSLGLMLFYFLKNKRQLAKSADTVFLQVLLPRVEEEDLAVAEQFINSFSALKKGQHVSFEIVAKPQELKYYLAVPASLVQFIQNQVNSYYPASEISIVEPWSIFEGMGEVAYTSLRLQHEDYLPLKIYSELTGDPQNLLTTALSCNNPDEESAVQFLIKPSKSAFADLGKAKIKDLQGIDKKVDPEKPVEPVQIDTNLVTAIEGKIGKAGYDVCIRILAKGATKEQAENKLKTIVNAFEQLNDPLHNSFTTYVFTRHVWFVKSFIYRLFPLIGIKRFRGSSTLTADELASFVHFPGSLVTTPHITGTTDKASAPPSNLAQVGLYLGKSLYHGIETRIFMQDDDRRRHMYVIGQTGTGKSEFMKFMALQDIHNGHGVAFLDPHGSAIDDLLERIPPERAEDVIYFDAADTTRPLGINIMEAETEEQKHVVINSFIGLLYKLYDPNHQGIMGPQLERAVRNSMLTAMETPGSTLIDVYRLIVDAKYAESKIPLIKDPIVKSYWVNQLAKTSDFHKSETLGYFVSKFDRFITDYTLRGIIGQSSSSINFRELMDNGKILLIDLSKGKIGEENSQFLGMILVPKILVAAMSRANIPESERRDFYLYVDEFQNFATPDFVQILSEARKYRLNLTVANQFIAQLTTEIKDSVFGNVGTAVSFRVGMDDATYMSHQFNGVFTENDLISSSVGHAYLRLLVDGKPSEPFSMVSDWESITSAPTFPDQLSLVKKHSALKFGRDRTETDKKIMEISAITQEPEVKNNA